MDIAHDASAVVTLLHGRDSSGRYDDVIDMFTRIAQNANRLVRVATCRHTDDVVMDRSASGMRDRPPQPTTTHACRGTSVQLPRTPVVDTAGPSEYQHATMSTLPQPFQTRLSSTGFTQPSYIGFNPSIALGAYISLFCCLYSVLKH